MFVSFHFSTYFSSIFSTSFHYSIFFSSIFSISFHYSIYLSFSSECLLENCLFCKYIQLQVPSIHFDHEFQQCIYCLLCKNIQLLVPNVYQKNVCFASTYSCRFRVFILTMSFSSAFIVCRFRMFTLRFNYQYSYRNMQLKFVVSSLNSLHS